MTTTHRHDNNRPKTYALQTPHMYVNATKCKFPAEVLNKLLALRCCSSSFMIHEILATTLHVYLQQSNICSSSSLDYIRLTQRHAYNRRGGNIKRSYRYILYRQTTTTTTKIICCSNWLYSMLKEIQLWAYSLW